MDLTKAQQRAADKLTDRWQSAHDLGESPITLGILLQDRVTFFVILAGAVNR
jgi:hypothetical protein